MRLARLLEIARKASAHRAKTAKEARSRRGSKTSAAVNVSTHRTRIARHAAKAVAAQAHKHTNSKARRLSRRRVGVALRCSSAVGKG